MADIHTLQRLFWDKEHASPHMVLNMDYETPSGGVVRFFEWVRNQDSGPFQGIEMGCGKGRNAIWLGRQGVRMTAFDFSAVAIEEAEKRRLKSGLSSEYCLFLQGDATQTWPFEDHSFDFGIDCFASTDIETPENRAFARGEFRRVLKPGGYLFVYAISSHSPFHKCMLEAFPAQERNSYSHPGSKLDKIYDDAELREWYGDFEILAFERVSKDAKGVFYGKEFACENFWVVLRS